MNRPYFNLGIGDLEQEFLQSSKDREQLRRLHAELLHRSTPRASRLRLKVEERIAELGSSASRTQVSVTPSPSKDGGVVPAKQHPSETSPSPELSAQKSFAPPEAITFDPVPVQKQPIENKPKDILSAWTALEVLAPPSFRRPEDLAGGDRSRVAWLGDGSLPWERGEKSKPKYRLYYQIVLGTMKLQPAVESLLQRFGDSRPEHLTARGSVPLAVVIVNKEGKLVESPAVGVSSFAWGVMQALRGDLIDLANWSRVEADLVKRVEQRLLGISRNGEDAENVKERPLTRGDLMAAFTALVGVLGLPPAWVDELAFSIRSYSYFKDPSPPDPLILNSFFLEDLALASELLKQGEVPPNLQRYLGMGGPADRRDLLQDSNALAETVRPSSTPVARWPGSGRHPLVLLQQAAVNLAFEQTAEGGLVGINGPPGTGKATLLRDIVAGVVAGRAEVMCGFDDPEAAFTNSGQRLKAGEGWIHLYRLSESLRGFEMVVASSNNKAVENVSAELPGLGAIAEDEDGLRYFRVLSDALHGTQTWGAIAAVLGNAQNRNRFKQTFWWDDEVGLAAYLRAVVGLPTNTAGRQAQPSTPPRIPRIVEVENPPESRTEALRRWNAARQSFQNALAASRKQRAWLEEVYSDLRHYQHLRAAMRDARSRQVAGAKAVEEAERALADATGTHSRAQEYLERSQRALRLHKEDRPGFWARLFRTTSARVWSDAKRELERQAAIAGGVWSESQQAFQVADVAVKIAQQERQTADESSRRILSELEQCEERLANARDRHGIVLADETFFDRSNDALHLAVPWFTAQHHRIRDDVFVAAIGVHRAFLDAAAKPLRYNLGALMNVFTTQSIPGAGKQAMLQDLWASLFLVVPLVSTTFASVHRMLGRLPVESLGWLLVDEAGQALPQAAVGAILRTKRAVVVGDPIQIQPVVTLPDALGAAICHRFGVDPDMYVAPLASVQTLADAASAFATEFPTRDGSRHVGIPLLVHRRCSEPMFSISNSIAYAGLMVSAKSARPSRIQDVLGPSAWIDVAGTGQDKWCEEEGGAVLELLRQLKHNRVHPDLYIVSPFVIVAERLREVIATSGILEGWTAEENRRWVYERVGTVHTVQGREAEAVIVVLGAPLPGQTGARNWAGWPPNLLNAAVTRAKEAIYVVGNRELWREAGCFATLDKAMP